MRTEQLPQVRHLEKKHLPAVAALEVAAAHDPRLVYEGVAWTGGGVREYLRGGRGLVAVNEAGTVVGFALFHAPLDCRHLSVAKLVAPSRPAHRALYIALLGVAAQLGRDELKLPIVLELG